MQYKYITCELPSNGVFYNIKEVHIRPKTIFDIKALLGDPVFTLRSEINTLQNCIDPNDNIDVYDLVNQDVVYLLYKLRSLSDDNLTIIYDNKEYPIKLSELKVKNLDKWDSDITLPESNMKIKLNYTPIKNIFNLNEQKQEFDKKYPDYAGDSLNTVAILNSISCIDNSITNKDMIRNTLEQLSYKDSIYLINKIEESRNLEFGIIEEITVEDGKKVPIQITEEFFRPSL